MKVFVIGANGRWIVAIGDPTPSIAPPEWRSFAALCRLASAQQECQPAGASAFRQAVRRQDVTRTGQTEQL